MLTLKPVCSARIPWYASPTYSSRRLLSGAGRWGPGWARLWASMLRMMPSARRPCSRILVAFARRSARRSPDWSSASETGRAGSSANSSSRSSRSSTESWAKLLTKLSGFLSSWATPAVSCPSEAIFSCWTSWLWARGEPVERRLQLGLLRLQLRAPGLEEVAAPLQPVAEPREADRHAVLGVAPGVERPAHGGREERRQQEVRQPPDRLAAVDHAALRERHRHGSVEHRHDEPERQRLDRPGTGRSRRSGTARARATRPETRCRIGPRRRRRGSRRPGGRRPPGATAPSGAPGGSGRRRGSRRRRRTRTACPRAPPRCGRPTSPCRRRRAASSRRRRRRRPRGRTRRTGRPRASRSRSPRPGRPETPGLVRAASGRRSAPKGHGGGE